MAVVNLCFKVYESNKNSTCHSVVRSDLRYDSYRPCNEQRNEYKMVSSIHLYPELNVLQMQQSIFLNFLLVIYDKIII